MPTSHHDQFDLPELSLSRHPFFELRPASVKKWLDTLPKANLGETTKQLFLAVHTLNRVNCPPGARLDILETLRPLVHFSLGGMQKQFLNKLLPLSSHDFKVAKLCHTLNRQLATGYCLVTVGLTGKDKNESLALAIHRALAESSGDLLRHYQLYTDPEKSFWLNLHRLFGLALEHKVNEHIVKDAHFGNGSVQQCYLRPLMLASANPYQLTQGQLLTVFNALLEWVKNIHLQVNQLSQCLLIFRTSSDTPPIYRELRKEAPGDIGIDTRVLCEKLELTLQNLSKTGMVPDNKAGNLEPNLLKHLLGTWSQLSTRNAPRIVRNDPLYIAIGLQAAHFFVANQTPFQDFSSDKKDPPRFAEAGSLKGRAQDVWSENLSKDTRPSENRASRSSSANLQAIEFSTERTDKTKGGEELYETRMFNASTTGYSIHWPLKYAAKLRTGTIAALHEVNSQHWRLATVRWIRQENNLKTQIGLELLADAVQAYSARVQQAGVPHGKPQRALLLAANDVTGTPLRVLLPRPGFHSGQNLELRQPEITLGLKLDQELERSASFSLYSAHRLPGNEKTQDKEPGGNTEEFDSLWKRL